MAVGRIPAPPFDHVTFQPAGAAPLYQQLYAHLRAAILAGELPGGLKLPSTRALAEQLGVSRNTILNAYGQLLAEGYLESAAGSGTYVAPVLPEANLHAPAPPRPGPPAPAPPPVFSHRAQLQLAAPRMAAANPVVSASTAHRAGPRPFRFGLPALDKFPFALWSRLVVRRARHLPATAFDYQGAAGYRPLREAIAAHAALARGVRCTAEQVVIVSGSQGGLDLAARMLLNPGDAAWVEDPGYLDARGALLGAGATLVPVPVDADGLVVAEGVARAPQARLVYITPSHQFPLGVTLSLARRLALLEWAQAADAYILEDDYDSEYRFEGRPLAALQGLDTAGRVIYLGTFSKVLFPALRIGYLILPPALVAPFLQVRRLIDVHGPLLEQAVLADFLAEGHFTRHLRRMRTLYAERRAALLEALRPLPLEVDAPPAGLHCLGWLPPGMTEAALLRAAAARDLVLWPVSTFAMQPLPRPGVVLGYAEYTPRQIRAAVQRLAEALRAAA